MVLKSKNAQRNGIKVDFELSSCMESSIFNFLLTLDYNKHAGALPLTCLKHTCMCNHPYLSIISMYVRSLLLFHHKHAHALNLTCL